MKKTFLILSAAIMMCACGNKQNGDTAQNPFLTEWDTPYGIPPFEQIEVDDYLPAFREGIKQHQAEIQAIIDNTEEPDFENTIAAMDRSGRLLSKVGGVFYNITQSDGSDELNAVMEQVIPIVSEHSDNIYMNPDLFKRVEAVYNRRAELGLTTEQATLLDKVYNSFVRNGIALDNEKQARLREINKQLSALQQKFGTNLLNETNAFRLVLDKEEDLAGLPEAVRTAAAETAKAAGMEGKWLFTLHNPSYMPFMQYSSRRDLREKMFRAYSMRGNNGNENDNKAIVADIIRLRGEKAAMLGFDTPAAFILDDKMAKDAATVEKFLAGIFTPANNKAREEVAEMQKIVDRENGGFKIAPWDWAYYTEKVRQEKYALNEDDIKPYFRMENVRDGVFYVTNRLYGLNFKKIENAPLFNPEAECFEVTDADGSLIGIFYTDYFPRASKRGGAWMSNIREQCVINGEDIRPIVINIGNFTKPTATTPSLLTLDEVGTLFHEFGHALHGLLAKANYVGVSGTNVTRDFVELPSQIMENWAFKPEVLAVYAKHYRTGEIIPDSLVKKIHDVATFNQGFITTELTAASILDIRWHDTKLTGDIEPVRFEEETMKSVGLIDEIIPRYRTTYFNHIWAGGYDAGYYGYLWTEVLAQDAFAYFEETGIFNPETARKFRTLLEKGGTEEPMKLYHDFRGADPDPDYLLIGRGLK